MLFHWFPDNTNQIKQFSKNDRDGENRSATSTPQKILREVFLRKLCMVFFYFFVCLFAFFLFLSSGTLKEKAPSGRVRSVIFPNGKLPRNNIILFHFRTQLYKLHRLVDLLTNLTKSFSTENCRLLTN